MDLRSSSFNEPPPARTANSLTFCSTLLIAVQHTFFLRLSGVQGADVGGVLTQHSFLLIEFAAGGPHRPDHPPLSQASHHYWPARPTSAGY